MRKSYAQRWNGVDASAAAQWRNESGVLIVTAPSMRGAAGRAARC